MNQIIRWQTRQTEKIIGWQILYCFSTLNFALTIPWYNKNKTKQKVHYFFFFIISWKDVLGFWSIFTLWSFNRHIKLHPTTDFLNLLQSTIWAFWKKTKVQMILLSCLIWVTWKYGQAVYSLSTKILTYVFWGLVHSHE